MIFEDIKRFKTDVGVLMSELTPPAVAKAIWAAEDRNDRELLGGVSYQGKSTGHSEPRKASNLEMNDIKQSNMETSSTTFGSYQNEFRIAITEQQRQLARRKLAFDLNKVITDQTTREENFIDEYVFNGTKDGHIVGLRTKTNGFYAPVGVVKDFSGYLAKAPGTSDATSPQKFDDNSADPVKVYRHIIRVIDTMRRKGVYDLAQPTLIMSQGTFTTLNTLFFPNNIGTVMAHLKETCRIIVAGKMEKDIAVVFLDKMAATIFYSYNITPLGPAMYTSTNLYYADFGWRCSGLLPRNREAMGLIPDVTATIAA